MEIENFTVNDLVALPNLQPEGWMNITPAFEHYLQAPHFCNPIKVVENNIVIGIGCSIIHDDVAWLGHIIVHKDYRKKGIGKLITQTLVESVIHPYKTIYLVATEMGAPLYERLGFVTETNYLFFKNVVVPYSADNHLIKPFNEKYLQQMLDLDEVCTGEKRLHLYQSFFSTGFVYEEDRKVLGFYLPDFREGLIVAQNFDAGLALVTHRLKNKHNIIVFPENNLLLKQFLYNHGFIEYRLAKRMRLGIERTHNLSMMFSRVAGNIG